MVANIFVRSFFLSFGPDRLAPVVLVRPVSFSSVCRLESRLDGHSTVYLSFLPSSLYFGGHKIFSSNDVASPETGFVSVSLSGVSLESREAALLEVLGSQAPSAEFQ